MSDAPWWKTGIVYQIYPRSFHDANDDGVGDLAGIRARLDYLRWLGVDAIWISPIYPSPMADFGYDVADYTGIHPMFGTMEHFDGMLAEAHRLGIRVILDLVPNHTSDQHPWFVQSRSSRDNPKRDWYIWADPGSDGGPPNNWVSNFGGSAWTLDAATGQYYYHAYLREQPDLNWRNPEVEAAMTEVIRFWLDRGVDGFRVDALRQMVKDARLRDNPLNPAYRPGEDPYQALLPVHTTDRPEVLEIVQRMRLALDGYPARVLIGELYLPIERLVAYYGPDGSGCHLPFNFHLISTPWTAEAIAELVVRYEAALPPGAWPNWVLGNHDRSRISSRVGERQARVAAVLLLTLRGTPTLYYGDEIGMHDVPIPPERVQDSWERNVPGLGLGRDPERTPMQWSPQANAGFTRGDPWLPLAWDCGTRNVETQRDDPDSMLSLYHRLIRLRRREPALHTGGYAWVRAQDGVLAYLREAQGRSLLTVLNLRSEAARLTDPDGPVHGEVVVSTHRAREGRRVEGAVEVEADEALVVQLTR